MDDFKIGMRKQLEVSHDESKKAYIYSDKNLIY